jgi:hypothetical protein
VLAGFGTSSASAASSGPSALVAKSKCKKGKKSSASKRKKCKKKKKSSGSVPAIGASFGGDPNVTFFKIAGPTKVGPVFVGPPKRVDFNASAVAPDCNQKLSTGDLSPLITGSQFGQGATSGGEPEGTLAEVNGHFTSATSAEGTWRAFLPGAEGAPPICDTGQVPFKVKH